MLSSQWSSKYVVKVVLVVNVVVVVVFVVVVVLVVVWFSSPSSSSWSLSSLSALSPSLPSDIRISTSKDHSSKEAKMAVHRTCSLKMSVYRWMGGWCCVRAKVCVCPSECMRMRRFKCMLVLVCDYVSLCVYPYDAGIWT